MQLKTALLFIAIVSTASCHASPVSQDICTIPLNHLMKRANQVDLNSLSLDDNDRTTQIDINQADHLLNAFLQRNPNRYRPFVNAYRQVVAACRARKSQAEVTRIYQSAMSNVPQRALMFNEFADFAEE